MLGKSNVEVTCVVCKCCRPSSCFLQWMKLLMEPVKHFRNLLKHCRMQPHHLGL